MGDLEKIALFIEEHHVMSLATFGDSLSLCSLFYAYHSDSNTFVVASSNETQHIKDVKKNSSVAGNILLETKSVGKIQGLQFKGEFKTVEDEALKKLYFKEFPYALALLPTLWQIEVEYFKYTDNRLGFGKKLIWSK